MELKELLKLLEKAETGAHISVLSDSEIAKLTDWVPTPLYDLNRIISGSLFKGIPSKMFTFLVGPEAAFKSSLMAICLANAQRQGYTPVVIDTEGAWTDEFVTRWGLDPKKILYIYTPWISQIQVILGELINSDTTKLAIAIDSIGGIERMKLLDDSLKGDVKADQGTLQKELKRMLKMLVNICKGKNSIAFGGGHYYGNPSGYGEAEQIGGGKYVKLAADLIISLKKEKIYDDPKAKDRSVIGSRIKAITLKDRLYPPFNEASIEIDYINGINQNAGLLEIGLEAGIFSQGGAWFTHVSSGNKVQGAKRINELFNETVLKEIDEWVQKTGYSTINENVREAASLMDLPLQEESLDEGEEKPIEEDKKKVKRVTKRKKKE